MLEPQRRITSNLLMQDESAKKERKQIYVPLALVERKKTEKRHKLLHGTLVISIFKHR
jgi:hypothetical protein